MPGKMVIPPFAEPQEGGLFVAIVIENDNRFL
jgi:hypothetical protein